MIELPATFLLVLVVLLGGIAVQLRTLEGRLADARRTIDRQAAVIKRQNEALRQVTDRLDPGREMVLKFGPGRRDLTAFFAEWGRIRLKRTDISEIETRK